MRSMFPPLVGNARQTIVQGSPSSFTCETIHHCQGMGSLAFWKKMYHPLIGLGHLAISERNLFLHYQGFSFYTVKNLSELIYLDFKLVQKIKKHGYGTRVLLNCPNCRRCQDKNPLGSRWVSCLIHQESQQCWAFNTVLEHQIPLSEMFGFNNSSPYAQSRETKRECIFVTIAKQEIQNIRVQEEQ